VQTAIPTGKKSEAAMDAARSDPSPAPPSGADAPANGEPPRRRPPQGGGRGAMMSDKPTEVYQFVLLCLDRQSGKTLWQKIAREELPHEGVRPNEGSFASASPFTDGKYVFAYFGSRGLHCYDMNGDLKWEKDFGKFQIKNGFGEGSSAVLSGNTIVVVCDHDAGSFITALDKDTGRELWRESRDEMTSWATPLVVQHDGKSPPGRRFGSAPGSPRTSSPAPSPKATSSIA
jgi:outer membrane protein assembly factor BamB